jgi:gamma-glutamyltranspeptidase/glutathione hydrolase
MNEGKVVAILGTPGGINIFNTMAEVIIRLLDFGQSPVEAVDAPRFSPRVSREKVNFEGRFSQDLTSELEKMGHNIRRTEDYNQYLGGVQLIYFDKKLQKYIGVSDPRRAGAAKGLN